MVALLDARPERAGRGDREAELDLAALTLAQELESGVREDRQGRCVRRHHLGDEPGDAGLARPAGELLEQAGADPAALLGVVDGERHLGRVALADSRVAPDRDDALVTVAVREPAGERAALRPVRIEQRLDEPRLDPPVPVEAQVPALVGQTLEEREQGVARRATSGGRSRSVPPSRRTTSTASATACSRLDANELLLRRRRARCSTGTASARP